MKTLFLAGEPSPDYQADSVFFGLRELFGTDVIDIFPRKHMYKGADVSQAYGKGFSLFGLIEEGQVDRDDIPAKLRNKFFDYVVFGSVQREFSMFGEVWDHYPPGRVIYIDGEDNPLVMKEVRDKGIYLKRELHSPTHKVWPIQFGFPEEKIQPLREKTELIAPLDPIDTRTYVYEDEASYYASYGAALFGKTCKKSGWECMRHLEIMANHCVPWFLNLEFCPPTIMTRSPKDELLVAKTMFEYNRGEVFKTSIGTGIWELLEQRIFAHFQKYLTTKALATYVIDTVRSVA